MSSTIKNFHLGRLFFCFVLLTEYVRHKCVQNLLFSFTCRSGLAPPTKGRTLISLSSRLLQMWKWPEVIAYSTHVHWGNTIISFISAHPLHHYWVLFWFGIYFFQVTPHGISFQFPFEEHHFCIGSFICISCAEGINHFFILSCWVSWIFFLMLVWLHMLAMHQKWDSSSTLSFLTMNSASIKGLILQESEVVLQLKHLKFPLYC